MPNQLAEETSPYLLQHADNPVHWQPWSDEAFEQAAAEDKLVFLSIGYSTCHWCHVMAHESFENEAVAEVLNHHFISVKVDREELADIDAAYMRYLQVTTGQGGWPMSIWLDPTGAPVFGGTYFPPDDRQGRPGFKRICHEVARLWRDDRQHLLAQADTVMAHLQKIPERDLEAAELHGQSAIDALLDACKRVFDPELGGFGGAPKFPRPVLLRTLMQIASHQHPEEPTTTEAWTMALKTLDAMADGGLHDQLGGGFHRYSVDRHWHVPHYEKMLYDQGLIAMAYLDAWEISGELRHKRVTDRIFDYLLDTLRDANGAIHAAEDADSLPAADSEHTVEGAFWTWPAEEISDLLQPRDAAIFCAAYGVEAAGNARPESDPHGELKGANTLYRAQTPAQLATTFDCSEQDIHSSLADSSRLLIDARNRRPPPHRDDKIVTAWNGLAIAAIARGGRLFGRPQLIAAAREIADFLRRELWHQGVLHRSFRNHRGSAHGYPADYVCLIHGLLELHRADPDGDWLNWSAELQSAVDERFWDEPQQGYVLRPEVRGKTLMTLRDDYDGAEPSPNHLAIDNLRQLAELTGDKRHASRANQLLRAGSPSLQHPFACPVLVSALIQRD